MTKFQSVEFYRRGPGARYSLLPFRFTELDNERYVLTNLGGEFLTVPKTALAAIVHHELGSSNPLYSELLARQFLTNRTSSIAPDLLAIKVRTRYQQLAEFTRLHIFVVTLRCEHSCPYCQVSRQSQDKLKFDMSPETASAAIDLALTRTRYDAATEWSRHCRRPCQDSHVNRARRTRAQEGGRAWRR